MFRQVVTRSTRAVPRLVAATASRPALLRSSTSAVSSSASATPILSSLSKPVAIRCYSSAKEGESAKEEPSKDEAKTEGEESPEEALKKQLEKKDREVIDLKDRYLRQVAEFRNLQERTAREVKAARDFALQAFAKDLLDSIDNLDRALTTVPADKLEQHKKSVSEEAAATEEAGGALSPVQDLVSLHEGLQMTENILLQTLRKHGLERFDPAGDKFNPNEHDATFMAPQPDKEDGLVFHVQQKGYKLNGRVLRAAKVGVVKNK